MDRQLAIGIDIGGTAIKSGLVLADGRVLTRTAAPTRVAEGVDHVLAQVADMIGQLHREAGPQQAPVCAVGVGMPGTLSHRRGVVYAPPNLPGWRDVPVTERLSKATGLNVVLENDANCAALGEFRCGAGRGTRHMVLLTLGTGVGGGIVVDGRLWRGTNENAGEIGHQIVQLDGEPCNCGQRGCLEAYASASRTAARAEREVRGGQRSSLQAVLKDKGVIMANDVVVAAQSGDALAARVWNETCRYLALACLNIQHVWAPDCIVIAGGMSAAGEALLGPIRAALQALASPILGAPPELRLAALGNDAGFIGAALSVFPNDTASPSR